MNRREVLARGAMLGAAALLERSTFALPEQPLPFAKTKHGPIRGHLNNGISFFKGVPYGLDTAQTPAMSPSRPGFGTAKHIIFLQLTGGMSHIDTFDPKTGASKSPKGAISTKAGYQLTE